MSNINTIVKNSGANKIYISGQIKGLDRAIAFAHFERVRKHLNTLGYDAINPMQMFPANDDWSYTDYLVEDIRVLMDRCNAIYMLSNWVLSKGAQIELAICKILGGYEIYYEHTKEPLRKYDDVVRLSFSR